MRSNGGPQVPERSSLHITDRDQDAADERVAHDAERAQAKANAQACLQRRHTALDAFTAEAYNDFVHQVTEPETHIFTGRRKLAVLDSGERELIVTNSGATAAVYAFVVLPELSLGDRSTLDPGAAVTFPPATIVAVPANVSTPTRKT